MTISLVQGNTAANGTFTITFTGPSSFTLDGSTGNGSWTAGGVVTLPGAVALAHRAQCEYCRCHNHRHCTRRCRPRWTCPGDRYAGRHRHADVHRQCARRRRALWNQRGDTALACRSDRPGRTTPTPRWALPGAISPIAWFAAVQPVEDKLRQARRDALVAYLLGPGPVNSPGAQFLTTDDIFNYYLIDPEMCCLRAVDPALAALAGDPAVCAAMLPESDDRRDRRYDRERLDRMVVAAAIPAVAGEPRRSFFTPRTMCCPNYAPMRITVFHRSGKRSAADQLRRRRGRGGIRELFAQAGGVSRLVVAAHYNQMNTDRSTVLHVFARSNGTPPSWYYRTRPGWRPARGPWSAWTALNLDIVVDHLVPVVWDQRLHLIWPVFKEESEKPADQPVPTQGGGTPAHSARNSGQSSSP